MSGKAGENRRSSNHDLPRKFDVLQALFGARRSFAENSPSLGGLTLTE